MSRATGVVSELEVVGLDAEDLALDPGRDRLLVAAARVSAIDLSTGAVTEPANRSARVVVFDRVRDRAICTNAGEIFGVNLDTLAVAPIAHAASLGGYPAQTTWETAALDASGDRLFVLGTFLIPRATRVGVIAEVDLRNGAIAVLSGCRADSVDAQLDAARSRLLFVAPATAGDDLHPWELDLTSIAVTEFERAIGGPFALDPDAGGTALITSDPFNRTLITLDLDTFAGTPITSNRGAG